MNTDKLISVLGTVFLRESIQGIGPMYYRKHRCFDVYLIGNTATVEIPEPGVLEGYWDEDMGITREEYEKIETEYIESSKKIRDDFVERWIKPSS